MALTRRAAVAALIAVAVVVVVPLGGWMILWADLALTVAIAVDLMLAGSPRRLRVTRGGDETRRLDETATVTVTLVNEGRRAVRGFVRDAWPDAVGVAPELQPLDLDPHHRATLHSTLRPRYRAEFPADLVTVRSVGPLGLAARQASLEAPWRLRVLPAFPSRRLLPETFARLLLLDGRTAARIRGQGTEFDSLRGYVDGDDPRSIDWRATARAGSVVVRTWRPERNRRLVLVVDTGRTAAVRVGELTRLDVVLDATIALTAVARRAGDHVQVLTAGAETRTVIADPARVSPLHALADVHPELIETDAEQLVARLLRMGQRRSLIVIFAALEEAALGSGLLPLLPALTRRHQVVLASVQDPLVTLLAATRRDARTTYLAAAAERTLAAEQQLARTLHSRGVEVVAEPPERFASAVLDLYLALKAAGRL
ncbi:MAG: DUF58 domain-containing protein [Acidothermus sp.]|nr:DUF58 domain-containing protein [Acidothermus sp.]